MKKKILFLILATFFLTRCDEAPVEKPKASPTPKAIETYRKKFDPEGLNPEGLPYRKETVKDLP